MNNKDEWLAFVKTCLCFHSFFFFSSLHFSLARRLSFPCCLNCCCSFATALYDLWITLPSVAQAAHTRHRTTHYPKVLFHAMSSSFSAFVFRFIFIPVDCSLSLEKRRQSWCMWNDDASFVRLPENINITLPSQLWSLIKFYKLSQQYRPERGRATHEVNNNDTLSNTFQHKIQTTTFFVGGTAIEW